VTNGNGPRSGKTSKGELEGKEKCRDGGQEVEEGSHQGELWV